jgi:hypothetical protein
VTKVAYIRWIDGKHNETNGSMRTSRFQTVGKRQARARKAPDNNGGALQHLLHRHDEQKLMQ